MTGAGIFDQDLLIVGPLQEKAQWKGCDCFPQWRIHPEKAGADTRLF